MSEAAFKANAILRDILPNGKSEELITLIEKLSIEVTDKEFLTQKDKADLIKEIHAAKNSTILWSFLFWLGQLGAFIGFLYLKK